MVEAPTEPTTEDRAKFLIDYNLSMVGYEDTLATLTGDSVHVPRASGVSSADEAIDVLSQAFHEGVSQYMSNRREVGHSPVSAFKTAVKSDWPDWVKAEIAESEYEIFGGHGRDPDFMTDEEEEYLDFLKEEYL